jgi:plastocyanin domain-containing protein
VKFDGTLVSETTLHGTNNVLALEGRVNQRSVWISVEQVDPKVSLVLVQARTKGGGTDQSLCHQLDKEIALKLVR